MPFMKLWSINHLMRLYHYCYISNNIDYYFVICYKLSMLRKWTCRSLYCWSMSMVSHRLIWSDSTEFIEAVRLSEYSCKVYYNSVLNFIWTRLTWVYPFLSFTGDEKLSSIPSSSRFMMKFYFYRSFSDSLSVSYYRKSFYSVKRIY